MRALRTACLLFLISLATLGAGCTIDSIPDERPGTSSVGTNWIELEDGLDKRWLATTSTQSQIVIYRFQADRFAWRFEHSTSARSVATWQSYLDAPTAVVNGVYFNEDFTPSGLLITRGHQVSQRAFDNERSGLIVLDAPARILNAQTEQIPDNLQEAAQSYPWLIKDSQASVLSDSGLKARRTFIATDNKQNIYLGLVPMGDLTLYQLSKILAESDLKLERALNLDGGPSSGIAINSAGGQEIENSFTAVPNVIVVSKKKFEQQ